MFHEQVPHWNLLRDALRWNSVAPAVGALVLHGMVVLLVGGPPQAASVALPPALLEISLLPPDLSRATPAVSPGVMDAGVRPAAPQAAAPRRSPGGARGARGALTMRASDAPSLSAEADREAGRLDGGARGGDPAPRGNDAFASAMRRGQGQGAAQAGPAGVDKALSARLVPASLRCADLFPYAARSDQETLAVEVAVSPKGSPRTSRIVSGHAHEAVFDAAALACARRLQFVPARNTLGAKIEDRAVVRLRFARAS